MLNLMADATVTENHKYITMVSTALEFNMQQSRIDECFWYDDLMIRRSQSRQILSTVQLTCDQQPLTQVIYLYDWVRWTRQQNQCSSTSIVYVRSA